MHEKIEKRFLFVRYMHLNMLQKIVSIKKRILVIGRQGVKKRS